VATVSVRGCPGCRAAALGALACVWHPDDPSPGNPVPAGAHQQVDWRRLRHRTRWAATPTTFGPVVKVVLTAPLWLAAAALLTVRLSGSLHALAPVGAAVFALVALVWTRQVWRPGRSVGG
jgi:hypothetical protein